MTAGIDGADERRAKARAAVIARLAARLLPRAPRKPAPPTPPPASPFVEVPTPAAPDGWACVEALPVMPATGTWRSNCTAINPDTGKRCCLLAGHAHAHRHGRTEFHLAAAPGTTHFPRAERLTDAATSRHGVDPRAF